MAALGLTGTSIPGRRECWSHLKRPCHEAVIHLHLVRKFGMCGAVPTFFRMDSWHGTW
jgi:hypothetical protein